MSSSLSLSAQRVQNALQSLGFTYQVVELTETTRTASEAAAAIGCRVEQIVKSLVFRGRHSQRPILVIVSGGNRVNEKKVGQLLLEPIEKPDAEFVRQHTGFAIGGVPPLGHQERMEILIDEDLLHYEQVWAAAGTPNAVFRLDPADLPRMTGGRVVSVR